MPALDLKGFIDKANEIHNNKYDYSKIGYKNLTTKICIICPEHGKFYQMPYAHLKGQGCPKCKGRNLAQEEIINKFKQIHFEKYSYDKVIYNKMKEKVCIICPTHGEFCQTPEKHLKGQGCPICKSENKSLTTEKFIKKANLIHHYCYDYSKTLYERNNKKLIITCLIHGDFIQRPLNHLQGCGCPKCNQSKLENDVERLLKENGIKFISQHTFDWLLNEDTNKHLHLDFYLPSYNIAIECQGIQHFKPVDFAGKGEEWAKQMFLENQNRDEQKYNLCKNNNVDILYYTNCTNITYPHKLYTSFEEIIDYINSL